MSLAHNSFYYLIGRLASAAIGVIALFSFTRVLSPSDYGRYSVMVAVAGLVSGLGFQWLRQCLVKFGLDPKYDRRELLGSIGLLFISLVAATVVAAAMITTFSNGGEGIGGPVLIVATISLAVAQAWFELGADASRVDMNPVRYGVAGLLRAALCLAFGLLAQWLTQSLAAVVLGVAIGYLSASILTTPRWLGGLTRIREATWQQTKALTGYGMPLALTLGFTFIVDSADRLMLASMNGAAEAGIYASAYNLGQYALGSILAGLGLAVFPLASRCYVEHGADRTGVLLGNNLLLLLGFALPATLGLAFLAPALTRLLLGNFVPGQSSLITAIILVAAAFAGIRSYAYDIVFMLSNKTKLQSAILAAAASINVVLNWALIPRWGAVGAANATLISFALALCMSIFFGRSLIKVSFRKADLVKIIASSAVMAIFLFTIENSYNWIFVFVEILLGSAAYLSAIIVLNPLSIRSRLHANFFGKN